MKHSLQFTLPEGKPFYRDFRDNDICKKFIELVYGSAPPDIILHLSTTNPKKKGWVKFFRRKQSMTHRKTVKIILLGWQTDYMDVLGIGWGKPVWFKVTKSVN